MTAVAVLPGTKLKIGASYRITAISPGDPSPTKKVGDVLICSADAQTNELDPLWREWFGGHWFADYLGDDEGFGTLVTGLEELPDA